MTPFRDKAVPPDDVFRILKGRRIVLLLEDLNEYVGAQVDLLELCRKLSNHTQAWALAATCRDGPELGAVKEAAGTGLHRLFENIHLKLALLPLTTDEKGQLAHGIDMAWDSNLSGLFPTPGAITMAEPLTAMRQRFQDLPPEQKDILRALRLLVTAGILPLTHHRLLATSKHIFKRQLAHLGDLLDVLVEQAFLLRPARQDPVRPEPAYLLWTVTYTEGRSPEDDFPILVELLETLKDAEGLTWMGVRHLLVKEFQQALNALDRALLLRPDDYVAWVNKGVSLSGLERYAEALKAFDRALGLIPILPEAWHGKAKTLAKLGRLNEALKALDQALNLWPDYHDARVDKGVYLARASHYTEALEHYSKALLLRPNDADTWYNKGLALNKLGRYMEAVRCFERTISLKPNDPDAWNDKGIALIALDREVEALEAFDQAFSLSANHYGAWVNRGIALSKLGRNEEALAAYDQALLLRPNLVDAWYGKGNILGKIGRYEAALRCFDCILGVTSDDPEAWWGKGLALAGLGIREEAVESFCRAWRERDRLPDKGAGVKEALRKLGRSVEECGEELRPGQTGG
jgi:tetratricopeptide (TPR) repeat protein